MPHLSPMSWIAAIFMFWITLSMLASTLWWTNQHSFYSSSKYSSSTPVNSWKWL
uniref:ATP synthase F0 subunit 8 n=1 Tax=Eisenia nordenskioldi pallida TaxID=1269248 RepID=A0A6B9ISK5_9ANNE|nr:ATP synthase F0 subunit 8 [Eisenia nordenskioldi pallida]